MWFQMGSTGDDIKRIQEKLGVNTDGIFDAITENAVRTWQAAHGLTADGIVGPITWDAMFAGAPGGDEASMGGAVPVTTAAIKLDKLAGHIPDDVIKQIPQCADRFQINSSLRLAHFLAQCAHESGNFTITEENLNYSAERLKKVFPKYFSGNLANRYARQPEKIASRVYGDRMGNGDEASKEGYKFRGRGYIQLTGKDNYREFAKTVEDNIINDPDLVASTYPLLSAAWFWTSKSLNDIADKGANDAIVTNITTEVNGGLNGLAERIQIFKLFAKLLT
jgi:putative chitinase